MHLYLHSYTPLRIHIPGCSQNKVKRGATKGQSLHGTKTSELMCGLTVLVPARVHRPAHRCTALHGTTGGRTSQVRRIRFYRHDHDFHHSQHLPVNSPKCAGPETDTTSTAYSRQHSHCDCHCVTAREMLSTAGFSPSAPRQALCLTAPSLSVCLSHPKCAR